MQPLIHLAFVDDWELSGDGSGDPHELQFRPMRELVRIYNSHSIRGSFNAEVMQQLTFRKLGDEHPEGNSKLTYRAIAWVSRSQCYGVVCAAGKSGRHLSFLHRLRHRHRPANHIVRASRHISLQVADGSQAVPVQYG